MKITTLLGSAKKKGNTALMEGKRTGLLVTGADAYEDNAEGMFSAFDRIVDFLLARKTTELYVGECSVPTEIPEKVRKKAVALARSLVNPNGAASG
jgi:hypothetical protein